MFKYFFYSFFIVFIFTGCSDTQKNLDYSTREYNGISKDAILNAAKRVIKLSDEDFTISSKRNSISVIRAIPKNKGFTIDININELELNTTTEGEKTTTKLILKQKDDIFSDNQRILKGSVHTLFWDRVDYLLGLNKSWYSCSKYRLLMNFDGFFCDMKYNSNIYPREYDMIKDTTIAKPVVLVEENINPSQINLTSMDGIVLPFTTPPKENDVVIADLNTSGLFDLKQNATISNDINDTNQSIIDINSTEDNNSNTFVPDLNSTILEYIEKPLPDEIKINDQNITILDNNQSINHQLPEVNQMIIVDNTNDIIEKDLNSTENLPIQIDDSNKSLDSKFENQEDIKAPIITPQESQIESTKPPLSNFGKIFMESDPKNDYTINLAIAYTKEQSDKFINDNNIKDNSFAIGFVNDSDNKYYIKIMYGVYKSKADALKVLENFSKELKANKPTVESVEKKQTLFNKKGEDLSVN
jgi:hypothetical protein